MSSSEPPPQTGSSLRHQFLRGGALLAGRQVLTLAVSLGGMAALTKLIGPAAFGLYTGALGVIVALQALTHCGIKSHLLRRAHLAPTSYDQAFWLLTALGIVGSSVLVLAAPWLAAPLGQADFSALLSAMALGLPLLLMQLVPIAKLERELDFRGIALIESGAIVVHYGVALTLAWHGWGVWAPLVGWLAHLLVLTVLAMGRAGYRPAWTWSQTEAQAMLSDGLATNSPGLIWQLRSLAPALIVGPIAGPVGMGVVALAARLVEAVGFSKAIAQRLGLNAFSRLQHDREALHRGVTQALALQTLALGTGLAALCAAAPTIIPWLFGPAWAPMAALLPFIALGYLAHALSQLCASALHALDRSRVVALGNGLHVVGLLVGGWLLMPTYGLLGYGLAELVAIAAYGLIVSALAREIGSLAPPAALVWFGAFALAMFMPQLGVAALVGVVIAGLWPGGLTQLAATVRPLWEASRTPRASKKKCVHLNSPAPTHARLLRHPEVSLDVAF